MRHAEIIGRFPLTVRRRVARMVFGRELKALISQMMVNEHDRCVMGELIEGYCAERGLAPRYADIPDPEEIINHMVVLQLVSEDEFDERQELLVAAAERVINLNDDGHLREAEDVRDLLLTPEEVALDETVAEPLPLAPATVG